MGEKYTAGDLVDIIENEGLEYAVRHYCDERHIESQTTGAYWGQAGDALDALVRHLEHETGREIN